MPRRPALTSAQVIAAAVAVADAGGLAQVSMRNVGRQLGVEAMSLYHHVANKDALLDGLVEWVFAQIDLPTPGDPWREAMTHRAVSARAVLRAHPWALGLIESRPSPGPNLLRHHDTVLACLRADGFPVALAAHAFSAIDAYVYGFVLTEANLPFEDVAPDDYVDDIASLVDTTAYPHLAEHLTQLVIGRDYRYGDEFDFGLALVLDGLERHLTSTPGE